MGQTEIHTYPKQMPFALGYFKIFFVHTHTQTFTARNSVQHHIRRNPVSHDDLKLILCRNAPIRLIPQNHVQLYAQISSFLLIGKNSCNIQSIVGRLN